MVKSSAHFLRGLSIEKYYMIIREAETDVRSITQYYFTHAHLLNLMQPDTIQLKKIVVDPQF